MKSLIDLVDRWLKGEVESDEILSVVKSEKLLDGEDETEFYVEPDSVEHENICIFFGVDAREYLVIEKDGTFFRDKF